MTIDSRDATFYAALRTELPIDRSIWTMIGHREGPPIIWFNGATEQIEWVDAAFKTLSEVVITAMTCFKQLHHDLGLSLVFWLGRPPKRVRKRYEAARKQERRAARAAYREAQRQSI